MDRGARDVLIPFRDRHQRHPDHRLAPILNNWFGVLNPLSKMMMAALLVFFPVMINVTRGLVEVKPASLEEHMLLTLQREGAILRECTSRTCCRSCSPR